MSSTSSHVHNDEPPCFCPPHPGLSARIQAQRSQAQTQGENLVGKAQQLLRIPTDVAGLNDGLLFPPESDAEPSKTSTNEALERALLRGAVKFVLSASHQGLLLMPWDKVSYCAGRFRRPENGFRRRGPLPRSLLFDQEASKWVGHRILHGRELWQHQPYRRGPGALPYAQKENLLCRKLTYSSGYDLAQLANHLS
jgi:hypothetical protein